MKNGGNKNGKQKSNQIYGSRKKNHSTLELQQDIEGMMETLDDMAWLVEELEKHAKSAAKAASLDFSKFELPEYAFDFLHDSMDSCHPRLFWTWDAPGKWEYTIYALIECDDEKDEMRVNVSIYKSSVSDVKSFYYDFSMRAWSEDENYGKMMAQAAKHYGKVESDAEKEIEENLKEDAMECCIDEDEYVQFRKENDIIMQLAHETSSFMEARVYDVLDADGNPVTMVHLIPLNEDIIGFHVIWNGTEYALEQFFEDMDNDLRCCEDYSYFIMKAAKENHQDLLNAIKIMADRYVRHEMIVLPVSEEKFVEIPDFIDLNFAAATIKTYHESKKMELNQDERKAFASAKKYLS